MTDQRIERGQHWLEQLLNLLGMPATIDISQPEGANALNYWLTIDRANLAPNQVEVLIGEKGATLDAIQYLANASLNFHQEADFQAGYTIELDNYRHHRAIELKGIADAAVERVRATGEEVVLQSMSAAERRQMHAFFDGDPNYRDIAAYSRGHEPDRRLVVKLAEDSE